MIHMVGAIIQMLKIGAETVLREYQEPVKHLIKANIEILKALHSFTGILVNNLEKMVEEEKEPKREKLKVE
ncbi:MAG: hypothetical protein N3D09_01130 [Archaeoglobaceae archaeon]|nr:hypothetical protein [Archaeoglobaceae archaeon]